MDMTLDVMAHSLVYWSQDTWRAGCRQWLEDLRHDQRGFDPGGPSYGAVSAAKSALESHCRQLAMEFAAWLRRDGQRDPCRSDRDPGADADTRARELIKYATERTRWVA